MARIKISAPTTIDELIEQYGEHKERLDALKKTVDAENKEIKTYMRDTGEEQKTVGDWVVKYIIQRREGFNEEKALSILGAVDGASELGIIKTRAYIDFDALEKAIYDGALTQDVVLQLNEARETKEVETLRVTKAKGAK